MNTMQTGNFKLGYSWLLRRESITHTPTQQSSYGSSLSDCSPSGTNTLPLTRVYFDQFLHTCSRYSGIQCLRCCFLMRFSPLFQESKNAHFCMHLAQNPLTKGHSRVPGAQASRNCWHFKIFFLVAINIQKHRGLISKHFLALIFAFFHRIISLFLKETCSHLGQPLTEYWKN